jgi:DNA-binding transcriptional regulator GbsR (MarR family)
MTTDEKTKQDNKTKETVSPMSSLIEAMQGTNTNMTAGFGPEWFEAMSNVGHEMLTFMSERIKQDIQTQQELLQAKGIAEIQQIQAEFLKKAQEDYATEMAKLVEMGTVHNKHAIPV